MVESFLCISYSIFVDDLNVSLCNADIGYNVGGNFLNNLSNADDMVMMSPSVQRLRKLLDICENYAVDNDIMFNIKKDMTACTLSRQGAD